MLERSPTFTADELQQLYRSVGWVAYLQDPEMLPAAIAGSSHVVAARSDGRLVGLARVVADSSLRAFVRFDRPTAEPPPL